MAAPAAAVTPAQAHVGEPGRLRVASRNDRDVAGSYPELRALTARFPRRRLVLDGEIVALARRGAPSFGLLQQRMHVRSPSVGLLERVPVQFYAFDLLHRGTTSTLDLPYTRRHHLLQALDLDDELTRTPPYWTDDAGRDLMHAADLGLEGHC